MAINYVPLDKNKHKDLKVAVDTAFEYTKNSHLAAASVREFAQLAGSMPIVFIQDPKSGNHHAVVMLGTEQNQNLFLHEGKWQGPHVPMNILRYPFDVRPDGEQLGVYIDENSDLVKAEGNALFTEEGEPSDFLKNRQQFLADLANSEMMTQRFIKKIVELELLDEVQIRLIHENGQARNVTGMLSINEKKLLELDEAQVVELHKSGFLGAIYAVMMSLGQLNRLVELSNKTENPIKSMQLSVVGEEQQAANPENA